VTDRPLKIFFWSASEEDGTFLYRVKMPADELARLGHDVQAGTRIGAWAREEADVIVGQRICQTLPSRLWRMLAEERRASGRGGMVFELDDDLFNIHEKTNPLGAVFKHPLAQDNLKLNLRMSDAVTVSTQPLAQVVRKVRGGDPGAVHVVPNAIRAGLLDVQRQRPSGRAVMFGWQGSHTHTADWEVARAAVVSHLTTHIGTARLRFLGVPQSLDGLEPGPKVDFKPWTTDLDEHYRRIADFDVTLAPLALTKFNRSKSALRVQESLALGVPVIASDVPAYRGWVEHEVTGLLVRPSTAEWGRALQRMQDLHMRTHMAAAGREAAKRWTIEATITNWLDVYRSLLP